MPEDTRKAAGNGQPAASSCDAGNGQPAASSCDAGNGQPAASHDEKPAATIILASSSPRRRDLLEEAGVVFTVRTPASPADETLSADDLDDPVQACEKLAKRKAEALVEEILGEQRPTETIVIGADTMVVKGSQIYGKPKDAADATRMLSELSGCTHNVVTAVSTWTVPPSSASDMPIERYTFSDVSHVTFKDLSEADIAEYLDKGESFGKAGAYAIQGAGAALIDHYEGALDTIIGLPVARLMREVPSLAATAS